MAAKQGKAGKGRPVLPQMLCALALCFTMFIFAPAEMTMVNSTNFWFTVGDFLPVFAVLFAAAFAGISLVFLLLRKLPYAAWLLMQGLLLGATVGIYVQGTYLCLSGEALTSGDPVWREMLGQMAVNAGIWGVIVLACVLLALLRPKAFMKASMAVSALILVMEASALGVLLTQHSANGDLGRYYCSDKDQFVYSGNGDVIVLMVDTFDTRLMDQALIDDPDYADVFEDFTYYRNTSSSTMLTATSFMSFMTGEVCRNEEPYYIYCRRVMRDNPFFMKMKDNGMTIQIYAAQSGVFSEEQLDDVDNLSVRESYVNDHKAFVKEMLCMVGYRYMPTMMQPFLLRDYVRSFMKLQQMQGDGANESVATNTVFIENLRKEGVTRDDSRRFFKFQAINGAHKPTQMNRFMQEDTSGQVSQYEQLMGCFAMIDELFKGLKEQGVYDAATIIVMGDHGINDDWRKGICNPAMLVKYPGEKGPMRTSMAPVCLLDMRATALYGAGIDAKDLGTPVHEWEGTQQRERQFLQYVYDVPSSYKFYLEDITEYIVPQDATDLDAYVPSGRVFYKVRQ